MEEATDGEEAWRKIWDEPPDVVITDYQMPRLDGLGLIERIRSCPALAGVEILLLTAKGFELPAEEVKLRWNVRAVIPKPFSPRELVQLVERILAEKLAVAVEAG